MNEPMTATHGVTSVTGTGPVSIKFTDESSDTWSLADVAALLDLYATDGGLVVDTVRVPAKEWVEFATLSCPADLEAAVGPSTYDAESVLWVCATAMLAVLTRYLDAMEAGEAAST